MATYPTTPAKISTIDPTTPSGGEDAAKIDDAIRQTRSVYNTLLATILKDAGGLKDGVVGTAALADALLVDAKFIDKSITAAKFATTGHTGLYWDSGFDVRLLPVSTQSNVIPVVTNGELFFNIQASLLGGTGTNVFASLVTESGTGGGWATDAAIWVPRPFFDIGGTIGARGAAAGDSSLTVSGTVATIVNGTGTYSSVSTGTQDIQITVTATYIMVLVTTFVTPVAGFISEPAICARVIKVGGGVLLQTPEEVGSTAFGTKRLVGMGIVILNANDKIRIEQYCSLSAAANTMGLSTLSSPLTQLLLVKI